MKGRNLKKMNQTRAKAEELMYKWKKSALPLNEKKSS